ITQNKQQMQEILEIVQEFFDLNKINVNAFKSELILVNGHKEDYKNGIDFMKNQIIPKKSTEAVRYLGVWIQENGKKIYQKKSNKRKKYLMQDLVHTEKDLEKLNAKIRSCFHHSCGHSAKLPTSILYSPLGYKLFNLHDRQLQ
ncbi:15428_t:CDS:2, partial [Dentiscutata erythropus]